MGGGKDARPDIVKKERKKRGATLWAGWGVEERANTRKVVGGEE